MVQTKIFDDGELAREVEGEAVFQVVIKKGDSKSTHVTLSVVGTYKTDVFLDCLASACAAQIVDDAKNREMACMTVAYFMSKVHEYGTKLIDKKYPEEEEK